MTNKLPSSMRGVLHTFSDGKLSFSETLTLPKPASTEYLIKVEATALTNGELSWPRPPELNVSNPGVEAAGTVISSPDGEPKFRPGSRVFFRTTYPRAGSMREYSIALESELALMPNNLTFTQAAAVPVSALTAWQALFTETGLNAKLPGSQEVKEAKRRVFINGASGGVGLWAVQLAKAAGFEVVGTTTNADIVRELGAIDIINYRKTSITEWLSSHEERFDLVLDCVGGESLREAWHAAKENGLVVTIVPPADMQWVWDLQPPEGVDPTVTGKFFIMENKGEQLQQISDMIQREFVRPIVDSVYPIDKYCGAFERLASRRAVGKVVVSINGSV